MKPETPYLFPDSEIIIFTKSPIPGEVKTRVAEKTGSRLAAKLSEILTEQTIKTAVESGLSPVSLWVPESCDHPFIQSMNNLYELTLHVQSQGDLGKKMSNVFDERLALKHSVVLIGSDCPFIDKTYLNNALTKLKTNNDMVIGPAFDGGYVLIGLRQNHHWLFENIAWSQASVMQMTRQQAVICNYKMHELNMLSDIDYFDDIASWQPSITSVQALEEWLSKKNLCNNKWNT